MIRVLRRPYSLIIACGLALSPLGADQGAEQSQAERSRLGAGSPALGFVASGPEGEPRIQVSGRRSVDQAHSVTAQDSWHWGSITKSMTGTLIARLVEQTKVSWDDTLELHLGDRVSFLPAYREVTFRHLMSHRSGMPANIPLERFGDFGQTADDPITDRLRWVAIALNQEPVGPMEQTFEYSNNGVIVAGAMLEAATGESWETLIQREVFAPLAITGAGFGAPAEGQPRGHQPTEDGDRAVPPNVDNPAALGPAGRVHMPLVDIARYLRAHASRSPEFLTPESYDVLHTPPFGGQYAMGWVVVGAGKLFHNGSNTMWYAEMMIDLEAGTAAAVATNDGDIASVQQAVRALLKELMTNVESGSGTSTKQLSSEGAE